MVGRFSIIMEWRNPKEKTQLPEIAASSLIQTSAYLLVNISEKNDVQLSMIAGDIRSGLEMRTKFHERRAAKKKRLCIALFKEPQNVCQETGGWLES